MNVKGAIFNLSNGTLSINNSPSYYSNPTIEPIGTNGWYRCSVTWTATSLSVPSFGVSADGLDRHLSRRWHKRRLYLRRTTRSRLLRFQLHPESWERAE